jgi:hypothetical protein
MTEDLKTGATIVDERDETLPRGTDGPSLGTVSDSSDDGDVPPNPTDSMPRTKTDEEDETRPLTLPPIDLNIDRLSDRRLLELAIQCSPDPLFPGRHLPSTRFAADIALCNDRTLRRYEAGERDLPALLREKLTIIVTEAQKKAQRKAAK